MPAPALAAWILAGALVAMGPMFAPAERWVYRTDPGVRRKLMAYGTTIVILWALALAAVRISGWAPLLSSPAPSDAWLPWARIAGPAFGVATAAYFIVALLPLIQSLRGPRARAAYAAAVRRVFPLPGLLPRAGAECAAFVALSLTAGVCEEILFRGFLISFLHQGALALPVAGALAASSVIFGLGHTYQGFRGVFATTIAGLFMGLVFLLSGSLIPAMILHALVDAQMAYVLRPVFDPHAPGALEAA